MNTKSFVLKWENNIAPLNYLPGQFITLSWNKNGKEIRRSYSISHYNRKDDNQIQITIKRVENGLISRHFHDEIQVGDCIVIENIGGLFTLPNNLNIFQQIYFIVAGSGIAPVMPMIEYILEHVPQLSIQLIYSNRNKKEAIFYDLLNQYQQQHPKQLHIIYLFSDNNDVLFSRLNNTLLTQMLQETHITALTNILFYICGPIDYMDMVSITLLTEGVPKNNIKKELFNSYDIELSNVPKDTKAHKVHIRFQNGQAYQLTVQHPISILDTALAQGLRMPYSCGSGQCGTCAAKCIQGEVWMAYNEVLTDADIEKGLVLTCTGFPINGNVILEY